MTEDIDEMMKLLPQLTKEESDMISHICQWNDQKRAAFLFAKRIFEEDIGDLKNELD